MSDNFTAVEVLIKRMETNPDEFLYGGRLRYIAEALYEAALSPKLESERLWFLKDAERVKLIAAYREFCRAQFQAELFARLFEDKEPVQAGLTPLGNLMEKQQALLQQEYEARMARQQSMMARQQSMPIPTTGNPAYNAWPGGLLTNGGLK